jgi:hypothetical protein
MTKEEIDEDNDEYHISKDVCDISQLKNYVKKRNEEDDEIDYFYNTQDVNEENRYQFNFFPKMEKHKTKKQKKMKNQKINSELNRSLDLKRSRKKIRKISMIF